MNDWFVYMVQCDDGSYYTGITTDVSRRIDEHNGSTGLGARYTRARQPVTLIYQEACTDRSQASKRECDIKKLKKSEKHALIQES